jgi:Na+-transporting NADH:ubiquinone oxidoreductase subunit A
MPKAIKIKKGVDINLVGEASLKRVDAKKSSVYSLKPDDFLGLIPKLAVRQGDEVKAGDALFYDKNRPEILFTSPVSGEVAEIKRGAKRKILEVKVLADSETKYSEQKAWTGGSSKEELTEIMLNLGLWPFVKQRPYGIIANPKDTPKSIYVSGFDSAPLAADMAYLLEGKDEDLKTAFQALKLFSTDIHVGVRPGQKTFDGIDGIQIHHFSGPHPAGNVGVQIHHINPINKGEVVWTVNPADLVIIGRSLREGKFRAERTVVVAGSEIKDPQYVNTMIGANAREILGDNLSRERNVRIISGNVLTGSRIDEDGALGFYNTGITAIPEGDEKKFFLTDGWLAPGLDKFSLSRAYPSWLMKNKKYKLDTNLNGEQRAFVVTGELEKVFPFDIYPMQLLKSIMVNDIDAMEKLGIYEVVPEDFALCEVVCTSKINIQLVVEKGLEDLRKEFAS